MNNAASPRRPWASLFSASASYLIWGLFPLYWKLLGAVDATELIAHRVVWALLLLLLLVWGQGRVRAFFTGLKEAKNLGTHALSGALLSVNWLVYVWGVNAGHVIECSLGYFLVPLINVLLGRYVLKETLRALQVASIGLAAAGVVTMVAVVGRPPWIALSIAGTFGFYGLLRKRSSFGPLLGLTAETLLLAPLAAGYFLWQWQRGAGALGHVDTATTGLVLSTGVVTAIPLLLFAKGARGLSFTTLGLLQYLAPTCQFLLGWLAYGEPMSEGRAWAFALIWLGLLLYSADAAWNSRTPSASRP